MKLIAFIGVFVLGFSVGVLVGMHEKKPTVHKMEGGFVCITYRETMICGQSTNTRPSQSDTSPDETLSVTYSIPLVPSYSTEF